MARPASDESSDRRNVRLMCVVYFGFAMPIAMLGVAWPSIRDELDQPNGALGVLTTSYGLGRLVMSGSGGLQLRRRAFGAATGLAVGVLGLSSLAVAVAPNWPVLLGAVLLIGLASGALDGLGGRLIAAMGSVTVAGLLAGSYGVGATIGPAIVALGDRWRLAYVIAAAVALAGAVTVSRPVSDWPDGMRDDVAGTEPGAAVSWRAPAVIASVLTMMCFVGIEVTVGSWTATFLEDARELESWIAGLAVSGFWAGITVGRLALGVVRVESRHLIGLTAPVALAVGGLAVLPGAVVIVGAVVVGLALASFFPVVMAATAERVGVSAAPRVSGWQLIFGNIGATSIPAIVGVLVAVTDEWAVIWSLLAVSAAGAAVLTWSRHLVVARPVDSRTAR